MVSLRLTVIGWFSNVQLTLGCGFALKGTSRATESPSRRLIVSSYLDVVIVGGAVGNSLIHYQTKNYSVHLDFV
jgi:hypothetical protein